MTDHTRAAITTCPSVPLYDMHRGWPERRVPLSLAEIEELLVLLGGPTVESDEALLDQIERKLSYHRDVFVADVGGVVQS